MLTSKQVQWAKSHDWFQGDNGNGTIACYDRYTKDGKYYEVIVTHSDFRALKSWAGY